MKCLLALLLLSCSMAVNAWEKSWNESEGGAIKWDFDCLWYQMEPFTWKDMPSDLCGGFCLQTSGCQAFDWGPWGTCHLYITAAMVGVDVGHEWMCGFREPSSFP